MRKRITKSSVDGVKPQDKEIICWDDLLPGFGVRVRPTGRRYYILKADFGIAPPDCELSGAKGVQFQNQPSIGKERHPKHESKL